MWTLFFNAEPVVDYDTAKKSDAAKFGRFFWAMMDRGVYLPCSQFEAAFLMAVHTEEHVRQTIAAAKEALAVFFFFFFFPPPPGGGGPGGGYPTPNSGAGRGTVPTKKKKEVGKVRGGFFFWRAFRSLYPERITPQFSDGDHQGTLVQESAKIWIQ